MWRGKVAEDGEDVEIPEFVPVPAKLDRVEKTGTFGNDAVVKPAAARHRLIARVVPDRFPADFHTNFAFLELATFS